MGGVVEQIAAVEEGNDLDAGREDAVVEFVDLFVDAFEDVVGVGALLQRGRCLRRHRRCR